MTQARESRFLALWADVRASWCDFEIERTARALSIYRANMSAFQAAFIGRVVVQ